MDTCYRHSSRETGVSCSSCGRPICPDCMTPTSVGMRCPECSRDRTKVKTIRSIQAVPRATYALIAVNVAVFIASSVTGGGLARGVGGPLYDKGFLFGPYIADGHEYWRLLTSGFLHAGFFHLLVNMYFIYMIGMLIEPAIGTVRFLALYFASLLCGSFGALLLQPLASTVGASGAAFGLLGGAIVIARARGIDPWSSGLGLTLLINLVFTLTIPHISIGGHVGGVLGGFLVGYLLVQGERRGTGLVPLAGAAVVGAIAVAGGIAVAGQAGLIHSSSLF